jgi:type I restriction enzyme S subunit
MDTLISVRAPVGDVNLANEQCCLGRGIAAARPSRHTNPLFLFFALAFVKNNLEAMSSGTIFQSVNKTTLEDLEIPHPEKPQQDKIAAVLWKIQRAIEVEERLITTAQELKQSAMHQLFTRGLRNQPQHDTALGPLPRTWSTVSLGSLGPIGNGSTPLRTNHAYWANGTIPWLNSAKVYDITITKADQFVTPLAAVECHLPVVKPGSVLIAITGQGKTLGHAAVTAIETCVNQHIAFLTFNDNSTNPHFIRLFLESRYAELRGVASGSGSTKGALTCGFLKTFLVPSMKRDEQDEITSALMTIEAKIDIHKRKRAALQELFQTMLHQLMTAQIRVDELDIDTSEVNK